MSGAVLVFLILIALWQLSGIYSFYFICREPCEYVAHVINIVLFVGAVLLIATRP